MNEVVFSPAGESIELVDDGPTILWANTGPIVLALWLEGAVEDSSGLATRVLHERAIKYGYEATRGAVNVFIGHGARPYVERDVGDRRVYRIRLTKLPRKWYDRLGQSGHHRAAPLPAVVGNGDQPELEPELPLLNPIPSIDLAIGVMRALRRDELVPVDALPAVGDLIDAIDALVEELASYEARAVARA